MMKAKWLWLSMLIGAAAFAQDGSPTQQLKSVNINFMLRGYFYAGSIIEDKDAFGGFSSSTNLPKTVQPNMGSIPTQSLW